MIHGELKRNSHAKQKGTAATWATDSGCYHHLQEPCILITNVALLSRNLDMISSLMAARDNWQGEAWEGRIASLLTI